jgi:hypothetical protein
VRPVASAGVTRYTQRGMRLGGYFVPKGTLLLMPFDAVHHLPGNWADPDAFIPVSARCTSPADGSHGPPLPSHHSWPCLCHPSLPGIPYF